MCPWPVAVSAGPPCHQTLQGQCRALPVHRAGLTSNTQRRGVGPTARQHPGRRQLGQPRSQALAAVGAALLPQMWFSRRHIRAETTGQALAAKGKGVWQNAARKRKGSIATCCYTCRFSRVGARRPAMHGEARETVFLENGEGLRMTKPALSPASGDRGGADTAPVQAGQTLWAIRSLPHGWHRVKPQRFQEPRPCFRESTDKVISPRTGRGWLPGCPSLPEALRSPCQNSKQNMTQQRPSRVRKNSPGAHLGP